MRFEAVKPELRGVMILAVTVVAALAGAVEQAGATAPAGRTAEALTLLADIAQGRDQAVVATFNREMSRQLSSRRLANDWATYKLIFGRYLGHGSPASVTIGTLVVVRIPLRMARRAGEFRITFQTDGRVAGLYFLRRGVPL